MGKERNPEGGKTRLAEEINAQYLYEILCRMPKCVPSARPVGNGRSDLHAPAGGFNCNNIGMALYFMCRACYKKQNVSGYLKLAREQLPLPTLAAIARDVLQNHTSDLPDVSPLENIVRDYERLLPPSASTPAMATLPTSAHEVSRQTPDLSSPHKPHPNFLLRLALALILALPRPTTPLETVSPSTLHGLLSRLHWLRPQVHLR